MSRNLQSPTKLTEFAPLQPEEKQQSLGQLISKFFKLHRNVSNGGLSAVTPEHTSDSSHESLPTWAIDSMGENCEARNESYYQVDISEGRNLSNVLKRISNLLVLKSTVSELNLCKISCYARNLLESTSLFRY